MSLSMIKSKSPTVILYGLGALLLLAAAGLWLSKQYTDPERVFWATINQGLRTSGVTIEASQGNGNTSVHQTLQYSLGAANRSHSRTKLSQSGTVVTNEMIGTPTADYTRYLSIKTNQKAPDGHTLNFSKVTGVWAKNNQRQLFAQAVLGTGLPIGGMVVPVASLNPDLREGLMRQIHADSVYQVDFAKVKATSVKGRRQLTYDVSIQPVAYARLMKTFAKSVGLHDLDQLDPSSYKGQANLSISLTIDAASHHVVNVSLPKGNYKQTYGAYDTAVSASIPANTITVTELQQRLRSL